MNESEIFEIEITDVYNYLFSYGGQSHFFRNLAENKKFSGSKCLQCGFVWCPPRLHCSKCYGATEFVDLVDEGEIITFLELAIPPSSMKNFKSALGVALIRLDGADTCLKAIVYSKGIKLIPGTRVKAKYKNRINRISDYYFETV
ncbi:Zn-ribbon domain-containing OB-fold protein [Chloroflexota bacterium]